MQADTPSTVLPKRQGDLENEVYLTAERAQLFNCAAFSEKLNARLDALLEGRSILSFDVFDTLLLRDNISELRRFYDIGTRMAGVVAKSGGGLFNRPVKAVDAFLARHMGTLATYRASEIVGEGAEGSMNELHATASRLLVNSDALKAAFVEVELAYESERLTPNSVLLEYARKARSRGLRIVLLSDMYMHAEHIRNLLGRAGIEGDLFDAVISSADTKATKACGQAFRRLEQAFGAPPEAFVHVGDNLICDFVRPMQAGWRALHLPVAKAEIRRRRADHLKTVEMLLNQYGVRVDIAMPH